MEAHYLKEGNIVVYEEMGILAEIYQWKNIHLKKLETLDQKERIIKMEDIMTEKTEDKMGLN